MLENSWRGCRLPNMQHVHRALDSAHEGQSAPPNYRAACVRPVQLPIFLSPLADLWGLLGEWRACCMPCQVRGWQFSTPTWTQAVPKRAQKALRAHV